MKTTHPEENIAATERRQWARWNAEAASNDRKAFNAFREKMPLLTAEETLSFRRALTRYARSPVLTAEMRFALGIDNKETQT